MTDEEAVRLSIASSIRDPYDIVGVLFGERLAREVSNHIGGQFSKIAITPDEFGTLVLLCTRHNADIERIESTTSRQECLTKLREALCTSLMSSAATESWNRPAVRLGATVASRMERSIDTLSVIVGEISKGDMRRVESVHFDLQDEEDEHDGHMLDTCESVRALSRAVVANATG